MLRTFAIALLFAALALPLAAPAMADQNGAGQASPPAQALTANFTSFLTDVLAGHVPSTNLSALMKAGLTPDALSQIDGLFATLGQFQRLDFVSQDTMQGYQRYHYAAVFDKGTQKVMFVTDSSGAIAGFFKDQGP